ncbi:MAG TPA: hypothetical protein VM513_01215 [Kofleriaceae bacterium]|jgi:hypothetical protein|nr:hypothetical protein [Kofleriaceae bacterium]
MDLDAITFRTLAKQLLPPRTTLSPDEAIAVVQIVELAVGADLDEAVEEHALLQQVKRHLCAIGGISPDDVPVVSPLPLDGEERRAWCERLAGALLTTGARELAYVLAYLVIAGDLELAPVEGSLIDDLQHALELSDGRADEIIQAAAELATPGAPEELAPDAARLS